MNHAVEILGDKWTLLILRDMAFHARRGFSELKAMEEGIATNILTDRLARLVEEGVVARLPDPDDGRRSRYELTEHGRRLVPLLLELMVWSRHHSDAVSASMELVEAIEADRDAAVEEILRRLDAVP